jgi:hypothetical protein
MAGWTSSDISTAGLLSIVNGNANTSGAQVPFYTASGTTSFHGDTVNVALFGVTPTTATALTDTLAHNVYLAAGGQWVTGNEVVASGYTAAGLAITAPSGAKTETFSSNILTFTSTGAPSWTITGGGITAYGGLVYDNTIAAAKYAYCWNYFGGPASFAGAGTFTINWNASGIFAITCS